MSYRSHSVAPERSFDYLYDPIYTTSCNKDVWKKNCVALHKTAPIQIFPVYGNMFSELIFDKRNFYTLLQNPLPYEVHPEDLQTEARNDLTGGTDVSGSDRSKYFSHPLSNVQTLNVRLSESIPKECFYHTSQSKTQGCQTMYRESSAQTLPWMPDACIQDDCYEVPEIIQVSHMIDGHSFPGIKEIEIIERARCKKDWEEQLPLASSPQEYSHRKSVLQTFEWDEYTQREAEIDEHQKMRFNIVLDMIRERDEYNNEASMGKLTNTLDKLDKEKKAKLDKLKATHQRNLRKLDRKYKAIVKHSKRESTLTDYIETITVPLPPRRRTNAALVKELETSYLNKTCAEPQKTNIQKYMSSREPLWKPKKETQETQKGLWNDKFLGDLYDSLKHFRQKSELKRKYPQCMINVSPPSHTEESISEQTDKQEEDELDYQNALLLQKYMKGRAIQNIIMKGKEQYRDILEDLERSEGHDSEIENSSRVSMDTTIIENNLPSENQEKSEQNMDYIFEFLLQCLTNHLSSQSLHQGTTFYERELLDDPNQDDRQKLENYNLEFDVVTTYIENVLFEEIEKISKQRTSRYNQSGNTDEEEMYLYDEQELLKILKDRIIPEILSKIPAKNINLIEDSLQNVLSSDHFSHVTKLESDVSTLELIDPFMKENIDIEMSKKNQRMQNMIVTKSGIQELIISEFLKIVAQEQKKKERHAQLLAAYDAVWKGVEVLPQEVKCTETDDVNDDNITYDEKNEQESIEFTEPEDSYKSADLDQTNFVVDTRETKSLPNSDSDETSESSSKKLSFQRDLLNRIVNNLNLKLEKEFELEFQMQEGTSSQDK